MSPNVSSDRNYDILGKRKQREAARREMVGDYRERKWGLFSKLGP
jgi:hypothetical protein